MPSALDRPLLTELQHICGPGGVLHEPDELLVFESDANTLKKGVPEAVAFPRTTEQAAQVIRLLAVRDVPS